MKLALWVFLASLVQPNGSALDKEQVGTGTAHVGLASADGSLKYMRNLAKQSSKEKFEAEQAAEVAEHVAAVDDVDVRTVRARICGRGGLGSKRNQQQCNDRVRRACSGNGSTRSALLQVPHKVLQLLCRHTDREEAVDDGDDTDGKDDEGAAADSDNEKGAAADTDNEKGAPADSDNEKGADSENEKGAAADSDNEKGSADDAEESPEADNDETKGEQHKDEDEAPKVHETPTKRRRPLPEQGFHTPGREGPRHGELVEHVKARTVTEDWGREFGRPSGHRSYREICRDHPKNRWCQLHRFTEDDDDEGLSPPEDEDDDAPAPSPAPAPSRVEEIPAEDHSDHREHQDVDWHMLLLFGLLAILVVALCVGLGGFLCPSPGVRVLTN